MDNFKKRNSRLLHGDYNMLLYKTNIHKIVIMRFSVQYNLKDTYWLISITAYTVYQCK